MCSSVGKWILICVVLEVRLEYSLPLSLTLCFFVKDTTKKMSSQAIGARIDAVFTELSVNEDIALEWKDKILTRYQEETRAYHTLLHLEDLFSLYDSFLDTFLDPVSVQLCILFHDFIYEVGSHVEHAFNEYESAKYFKEFCASLNYGYKHEDKVVMWIEETARHTNPQREGDSDFYTFLDME